MARSNRVLLLLPLMACLVLARNDNSSAPNQSEDPLECQTQRAPDYYGLGVRLGIYFQWFSAYVASTMLPSEIAGALDQNAVFLFSILIAMVRCSMTDMLETIDGLILMHLSGGTIFGILSLWGYRTIQYKQEGPGAIRHYGGFGTHGRLLLSLAVSVYGLWFWIHGVNGALSDMGPEDDPPNSEACSELYTFMFGKVRARGGIRIFYIIVCTCCIVVFGTMALASTIAGFSRVQKMRQLWKTNQLANSSRLRFATGFKYRELKFLFKFWKWWSLIWLCFSVLLVEFSLNFNHVQGVLGGPNDNELHLPAQLLPLLIGAFSFARILWLTYSKFRSIDEPSPSVSMANTETKVRRARTLRRGLSFFQLFSPALAVDAPKPAIYDDEEIDPLEVRKSTLVRYFVSMMPWFSLLGRFGAQDEMKPATTVHEKITQDDNSSPERGMSGVTMTTQQTRKSVQKENV